jgi:glutaredoxin
MAAAPPCGGLLLSGAQKGPSPTIPFEMAVTPLPDLVLYSRPGCGLCDETRDLLTALLAERASSDRARPTLVERDIESDPALERAYFASIPVVELGDRRLELATSAAKLRRLLTDVLDA